MPTRLTAGHADNALPQSATATVNCRIFPGVGFEPVRAALASVVGEGVSAAHDEGAERRFADAQGRDGGGCDRGACELPRHADRPADGGLCYRRLGFRGHGIATYGVSGIFLKDSEILARPERTRTGQAFMHGLTHWYVLIKELAGQLRPPRPCKAITSH